MPAVGPKVLLVLRGSGNAEDGKRCVEVTLLPIVTPVVVLLLALWVVLPGLGRVSELVPMDPEIEAVEALLKLREGAGRAPVPLEMTCGVKTDDD